MKLDEYVNGANRDPMTLDKISSSANHPLTAAESLHPNDVQLLLTRAQYQATVSENVVAAKGTLQHAKGVGARKTVAPNLALAQVRLVSEPIGFGVMPCSCLPVSVPHHVFHIQEQSAAALI